MSPDPAQFRAGVRALVAEPLTDRTSPAFPEIRRHRRELTRFFADKLGYRLDATRPHAARLAKLPGPGHQPRGLETRGGGASTAGATPSCAWCWRRPKAPASTPPCSGSSLATARSA